MKIRFAQVLDSTILRTYFVNNDDDGVNTSNNSVTRCVTHEPVIYTPSASLKMYIPGILTTSVLHSDSKKTFCLTNKPT